MGLYDDITDPKKLRQALGLNQQEFWSKVKVTQSGGSRYETGRKIPNPVQELLRIVYIEQIDLNKINSIDFAISSILKAEYPLLYTDLAELVRKHSRMRNKGLKESTRNDSGKLAKLLECKESSEKCQ